MLLLVQSLRLIVLFEVSILICGIPLEQGVSSPVNDSRNVRHSRRSLKQKCSKTILDGMRRLNPFGWSSARPNDEQGACSICLGEYQVGDKKMSWPDCSHILHQDCAEEWRKVQATCPLCRGNDKKLSQELAGRRLEKQRNAFFEHLRRRLLEIGNPRNEWEEREVDRLRHLLE
ncbi:hypothetical protein PGT21_023419 [Puccinia graminis f. sp. tritici]|uniref:RING-type domain-containing protein n=1 Tax=Puccinia graminis f. sp. tritici TaxID=56615 RepID=A0A5B0LWM9_PUCGR|nr:hypothetical protein PGTUg99_026986 [Puccinia graminis f. sp. tritici]KAA1104433.1 hypothetical protein PGT21_023419 [Puccinia graminis f. sp. tritici]